ncbi:MAG: nucleoside triphosphate pyrophosphohydrolase [Candidatus Margulisbacteria bacterium]|nr:nucleoside triphosphate pyrophosphohydrolase [Candidatus Margulisiibacteriota bacterium]MBU1022447.1 nucleoside triphosphate pyrophosphohydrolase [Candidatus Margulisiibacteriota bacterium]MBU1728431.1 nucleoside triphosphate pyrophosphohydrolase [Candidatus Margulisiibacteriota bacterium]MBU1954578.1 nucleoside triphosphate pyrophosphohydrolase [Candidatus Margulisiibacteriota bacterium]
MKKRSRRRATKKSTGKKFEELVNVVSILQSKKGCPWDRKQTHATLKPYMVEEVYEAMEAIDEKDHKRLADELGDMLLHICMHAEMGRRAKEFNIDEVVDLIKEKMIRRHPHVFAVPAGRQGDKKSKSIAAIWQRWEKIKDQEKAKKGKQHKGILESVPQTLPALHRAEGVQRRAARVGFDWDKVAGAWKKVHEELDEVHELLDKKVTLKRQARLKEEIGDLMFAIVNVSRKLEINPEEALQETIAKFIRRFKPIEKALKKKKLTLAEMDEIWEGQK